MKKIFLSSFFAISFIAPAFSQGAIAIYEDAGFTGRSSALRPGAYSSAAVAGISNDALSSLTIPAGMTVILYENENFTGAATKLTGNRTNLTDNGWNDKMSSLAVYNNATTPPPGGRGLGRNGVSFFEDADYSGRRSVLRPGTYFTAALAGLNNDAVSSLTIPAGMTVVLYEDENLGGASVTLTSNQNNLTASGWNDRMSSFIIYDKGYVPPVTPGQGNGNGARNKVVLYEDSQFTGKSITVSEGRYNTITELGMGNDLLTSLQIPRGYTVILFEDVNLGGASVTLKADNTDLTASGWNDKASSLIVVRR